MAEAAALVIRIACGDICIKHLPKTVITIAIKIIVAVIFDRKPVMLYQSFNKKGLSGLKYISELLLQTAGIGRRFIPSSSNKSLFPRLR